jgi:3-hydroxyisobutyrate dehydrogenase
MADLAVLGTGAMGARMAASFVEAGHRVTVWNRTRAKAEALRSIGAAIAESPRAAAARAGFVVAMVRDDTASRAVWLDPDQGALAAMARGGVAVECSTLSITCVRQLTAQCVAAGVEFLDAPVVGSRPQAETARLIYLVGGDGATLARAQPILTAAGNTVFHAGANGSGAALKLAVNALFGIQVAAAAELFGLLRGLKVDLPTAVKIIGAMPSCSPAASAALGSMLAASFAPLFPAELAAKDFDYVLAAGDPDRLPLAVAARTVLDQAICHGFGTENLTGVVRLYADPIQPTT